jgi:hypothetical protein
VRTAGFGTCTVTFQSETPNVKPRVVDSWRFPSRASERRYALRHHGHTQPLSSQKMSIWHVDCNTYFTANPSAITRALPVYNKREAAHLFLHQGVYLSLVTRELAAGPGASEHMMRSKKAGCVRMYSRIDGSFSGRHRS